MAFCTSCGAQVEEGARFCNACGATMSPGGTLPAGAQASGTQSATQPAMTSTGATAPIRHSGTIKTILIVLLILVAIGMIGGLSMAFVAYKVARNTHISTSGRGTTVETPFGNIRTSNDPAKSAAQLGVALYPGAKALEEGGSVTMGGMSASSATFVTSDSIQKVMDFYKAKYPDATVTEEDEQHTLVVASATSVLTIGVESEDNQTRIRISRTQH